MVGDKWIVGMPQCPECLALMPVHAVDVMPGQMAKVRFIEVHNTGCSRYSIDTRIIVVALPTAETVEETTL